MQGISIKIKLFFISFIQNISLKFAGDYILDLIFNELESSISHLSISYILKSSIKLFFSYFRILFLI
jgi:hypothetical protein